MTLESKYEYKHKDLLRDARPLRIRILEGARKPQNACIVFISAAVLMYMGSPILQLGSDGVFVMTILYFNWLRTRKATLPFKLPMSAKRIDAKDVKPDGSMAMAGGILYLGNDTRTGEEVWFTNTDARTHVLYLGTTGSGKTFGLKSFSCNALTWASGYIYIDGKADTDLWSNLSAMARRFGRDDDLLIMNYMTGGAGGRVPSNTLNPFSSGSASYLTNMLVSLMPDAGGDNAMWKERAISLVMAIMPCLVWKRDNQNIPLSIGLVRTYLTFKATIKLSRDAAVPISIRTGLMAYLNELPGYVDSVFDDEGNEKPQPPDAGPVDTSVPRQQHGYLSMQFTRSMSSLGDDYGFIFDTQAADIDIMDVVLNRRVLIVLIPALEKSADETANLGKIIATTLRGMMGSTLGSTIEGDTATAIENKPTTSNTPFMAIFDEVGYYVAQGMAVMAAQARSLGFTLLFSAQDLPALEKRVKEEARSITANCNIKIFGKLEDPTQTREFFEKTVGQALVTEVQGFQRQMTAGSLMHNYMDSQQASIQIRNRVPYEYLKSFTEGRAVCSFGRILSELMMYNSDVGHAKAMRVHRFLPIPPPSEEALHSLGTINSILKRFRDPTWRADHPETEVQADIAALARGFADGRKAEIPLVECGILAIAAVAEHHGTIKPEDAAGGDAAAPEATAATAVPGAATPAAPAARAPIIPTREASTSTPLSAATAASAAAPAGGPMSWAEIIGGGESSAIGGSAVPAVVEPIPTETIEIAQQEAVTQELTWESALGLIPQPAAPPPAVIPPVAAPVTPPALPPEPPAEAATTAEEGGGLSWMDILGTGETTDKDKE